VLHEAPDVDQLAFRDVRADSDGKLRVALQAQIV
jgi:hypothetical protein